MNITNATLSHAHLIAREGTRINGRKIPPGVYNLTGMTLSSADFYPILMARYQGPAPPEPTPTWVDCITKRLNKVEDFRYEILFSGRQRFARILRNIARRIDPST